MKITDDEIELTQGDCVPIYFTVIGNIFPGQPIDVSGWTPYLTVKKNIDDPSALLSMTGIVLDASGTVEFSAVDVSGWVPAVNLYEFAIEKDPYRISVKSNIFRVLNGVRH